VCKNLSTPKNTDPVLELFQQATRSGETFRGQEDQGSKRFSREKGSWGMRKSTRTRSGDLTSQREGSVASGGEKTWEKNKIEGSVGSEE